MRAARAAIADALVAAVKGSSYPFNTVSKHFVSWDSQDTTSWPVAYVKHMAEEVKREMYGTSRYHVHYRIFCYALVNSADPNFDQEDQVIGPLLDALDAAFKPQIDGGKFDLSLRGVDEAFIEGQILIADGVEDGRAVVVVPVTVSVAG